MNWSGVVGHIADARIAHIATSDDEGSPHVAVVAPCIDGTDVWILTSRSSRKARNVAVNGRMALVWTPGAEVYLYGSACLVEALEEKQRLWSSGLLSFDPASFFGTPDNPDFVLLKIEPDTAVVMTQGASGPERHRWKR